MKTNTILQGDSLAKIKELPAESINCVMTSPPYWALRDYGVEGQLGLEPTFQGYINNLCDIFDEVKRVLRNDGTCWVNIGDTYFGSGKGAGGDIEGSKQVWAFENKTLKNCQNCGKEFMGYAFQQFCGSACSGVDNTPRRKKGILPNKTLTMIPFRFAIEMVNRGWILRNTIIWHKPNCMPSSVKDRFTVDFEYLFFFVKSKKYFFETQYEEIAEISKKDRRKDRGRFSYKGKLSKAPEGIQRDMLGINSYGRNKRAVWKITTKPFKESHFAVYPEELCETPIKSGCPEFICNQCGNAREKIIEIISGKGEGKSYDAGRPDGYIMDGRNRKSEHIDKGYTSCSCNVGFSGGIVLDPFFGAGTTGLVALKQNKQFIGIELNPEYIKIANKRLEKWLKQTKLF